MKNLITILAVFIFVLSTAQEVTDYQYISVPVKFTDFEPNEYKLNHQLKILLKQKKYEPLAENKNYWPLEAQINPCLVLTADVLNHSTFFKNKLQLVLKDCNQSTVLEKEAISSIKGYQEGYSDALHKIVSQISDSKPISRVEYSPRDKQNKLIETEETATSTNKENQITTLSKGLKIVSLDQGEIAIIDTQESNILAHFYPATQVGIYHVKVNKPNGDFYYTIGYKDDNGTFSYEQTQDFKTWQLIELN